MKRLLTVLGLVAMLSCETEVAGPDAELARRNWDGRMVSTPLRVLTRNVFVGADVDRVLAAGSAEGIPGLVAEIYPMLFANDFHDRAIALAGRSTAPARTWSGSRDSRRRPPPPESSRPPPRLPEERRWNRSTSSKRNSPGVAWASSSSRGTRCSTCRWRSKVLAPDMATESAARRFLREARIQRQLKHPTSSQSTGWGRWTASSAT